MSFRLQILTVAVALSACVEPPAECFGSGDCLAGQQCVNGACEPSPAAPTPDAGAPAVTLEGPRPGGGAGGGPLEGALRVYVIDRVSGAPVVGATVEAHLRGQRLVTDRANSHGIVDLEAEALFGRADVHVFAPSRHRFESVFNVDTRVLTVALQPHRRPEADDAPAVTGQVEGLAELVLRDDAPIRYARVRPLAPTFDGWPTPAPEARTQPPFHFDEIARGEGHAHERFVLPQAVGMRGVTCVGAALGFDEAGARTELPQRIGAVVFTEPPKGDVVCPVDAPIAAQLEVRITPFFSGTTCCETAVRVQTGGGFLEFAPPLPTGLAFVPELRGTLEGARYALKTRQVDALGRRAVSVYEYEADTAPVVMSEVWLPPPTVEVLGRALRVHDRGDARLVEHTHCRAGDCFWHGTQLPPLDEPVHLPTWSGPDDPWAGTFEATVRLERNSTFDPLDWRHLDRRPQARASLRTDLELAP